MGAEYLSLSAKARQTDMLTDNSPDLCVGIPSVEREDMSYLKSTLGSLQHGLSPGERSRLRFVVFLAHVNQSVHSDYDQPWVKSMVDIFPSYDDDPDNLALVQGMQRERKVTRKHATKSKLDYSIVLEECQKTGATHTLMVEDDVVFLDGWLHRTMQALDAVTSKTHEAGHLNCK